MPWHPPASICCSSIAALLAWLTAYTVSETMYRAALFAARG
jgi:hypothetical protein